MRVQWSPQNNSRKHGLHKGSGRSCLARKHRAKYLISLRPLNKPLSPPSVILISHSCWIFRKRAAKGGGKSNARRAAETTTTKKSDRYSIKREIRSRPVMPGVETIVPQPPSLRPFLFSLSVLLARKNIYSRRSRKTPRTISPSLPSRVISSFSQQFRGLP